ncbi:MAG TPA: cupin domain-containing protein [Candidatus Anaerobiospirillum stercoravium]|nr:cupin domain-containing protein [Candidatus Anaerobiospirillum stercoravium]
MASLQKTTVVGPRTELHETLGLTGCEASYNVLPAGAAVPFVHAHKHNEELYIVVAGAGELYVDGEVSAIKAGDAFAIAPEGHRCLKAGTEGLTYICVQSKQGSLEGFTMTDAVMCEGESAF